MEAATMGVVVIGDSRLDHKDPFISQLRTAVD